MKKFKLYAIFVMAMAIIVTVAVVSCKKETSNALLGNKNESVQTFNPREIEDMNAYLKDFKQKMQSATKGEDESLSLEEAAWHLACLANFDFCNINVNYDDFLFDTIDMHVKVVDGTMLLNDIGTAYEQMCNRIQQFKKGFNHSDQNLYYINVSIDTNGNAKIALMTSFTNNTKSLINHTWYFSDAFEAAEVCDEYFSEDSTYYWNGLAATELQRVLNLFEHHENGVGMGGVMFFAPTRNHTFDYTNTYDPYISGYNYINESRVFAKRCTDYNTNYVFQLFEMCYCLDSYLGLGYDYLYDNEFPVCWTINCRTKYYPSNTKDIYHQLYVEYGALITQDPTPND